ncbi:histidine phosphatase family protein [Salinibacterium sp. GXW1014]|uniref:histidine phosphatase family protein n=1 Tax=Salinibacterium sp. GXW1014 TaxID=3377838 RepID=UPI00383A7F78
MRLHLIRHGQTPANVLGLLDTAHPGPGLTELGHEQARRIPAELDAIDALYTSELVRTHLTAEPLATTRGLDRTTLPGLHEIEAGDLEGRSDRDAVITYLKTTFAWGIGELDARMPGGPNGHDFFERYDADIETILSSGADSAALVSHGAAIRVWVARHARNVATSFAADHKLENTGIVVMEGSFTQGWTLRRWQETLVDELTDATAPDPTAETLEGAVGSEQADRLVQENARHVAGE